MAGLDSRRFDVRRLVLAVITCATALPLAAFFGFVGYMKAFAPIETLVQHHAWTTALPPWLGRLVGVSEILSAIGLVAALSLRGRLRWAVWIAASLVVNQGTAAAVHWTRGETGALPQNVVLVVMLIVLAGSAHLWGRRARR